MAKPRRYIDATLPLDSDATVSLVRDSAKKSLISVSDLVKELQSLPKACDIIPASATNLTECALYEIQQLQQEECSSINSESYYDEKKQNYCEDALDDGFFICDLAVVQRKLHAWRKMFPRIKPFFALKCNPDPMVAGILGLEINREIVGFDCASPAEISLALQSCLFTNEENITRHNNGTKRCIYANPQRSISDLDTSLDLNVRTLTFDGKEELHKVKAAYLRRVQNWMEKNAPAESPEEDKPQPPEMVLRLLVPDGCSSVPLGEKFGAAPNDVKQLTELACELGLPVIGVSFHCGSGCHDPESYAVAIKIAKDAISTIEHTLEEHVKKCHDKNEIEDDEKNHYKIKHTKCTLLDIGGGFPGIDGFGADNHRFSGLCPSSKARENISNADEYGVDQESTLKIARVVTPLIDELFPLGCPVKASNSSQNIHVISEPGRYFVEEAFALCSRIYSCKTSKGENGQEINHYWIAQGVDGVFKDVILADEIFKPVGLSLRQSVDVDDSSSINDEEQERMFESVVHGPSGEDYDIVCKNCFLPALKEGDFLVFDCMGAYTISIAALSAKIPIRYVLGGAHIKVSCDSC